MPSDEVSTTTLAGAHLLGWMCSPSLGESQTSCFDFTGKHVLLLPLRLRSVFPMVIQNQASSAGEHCHQLVNALCSLELLFVEFIRDFV